MQNYLNEKELTKVQAWGFTFSFGTIMSVESRDKKESKFTITEKFDGQKKVAFTGGRSYDGHIGGNKWRWGALLSTQMNSFVMNPRMNDFEYGLHLFCEQTEKKSKESEIRELVDQAILWKAAQPGEFMDLSRDLFEQLKDADSVTYSSQIIVRHQAFINLIPSLSQRNNKVLARYFAAATDFVDYLDIRNRILDREERYTSLWCDYFDNPDKSYDVMASWAQSKLRRYSNRLAAWEGDYRGNDSTFAGLIRLNGPNASLKSYFEGAMLLNCGIVKALPYQQVLEKAFNQIQVFWSQQLHIRALGRYIVEMASEQGIDEGIERIFTVTYKKNGREEVINLTHGL